MPPLPSGAPRSISGYTVHRLSDSWGPSPSFPIPRGDFTFRSAPSAPRYPAQGDTYRPQESKDIKDRQNRRHEASNQEKYSKYANGYRSGQRPTRGRSNHARKFPSDRPLLRGQNGNASIEQTLGVNLGSLRFRSLADLSDSEEEEMDMSESDDGMKNDQSPSLTSDTERPTKRQNMAKSKTVDEEAVPKWSNPDPYFVLPPIDERNRKKKDPVKFIRKAFKPAEENTPQENQVTSNDDFISFDIEIAEDGDSSDETKIDTLVGKIRLDLGRRVQTRGFTIEAADDFPNSRKRTYGDMIKGHETDPAESSEKANGSLLTEWMPRNSADAIPWLDIATATVKNTAFRLHREICDFYEFVRPQHFEQVVREKLLSRLQAATSQRFPACKGFQASPWSLADSNRYCALLWVVCSWHLPAQCGYGFSP